MHLNNMDGNLIVNSTKMTNILLNTNNNDNETKTSTLIPTILSNITTTVYNNDTDEDLFVNMPSVADYISG